MKAWRLGLVLGLWAGLLACVGPPSGGTPAVPAIQLGTGATSFQALENGSSLEVISGPQGGWHLNVAARISGMEPEGIQLSYEVRRPGGSTPINFRSVSTLSRRSVVETQPGVFDKLGDRAVLNIGAPTDVANQDLEVRVQALASDGQGATGVRTVRVVDTANENP